MAVPNHRWVRYADNNPLRILKRGNGIFSYLLVAVLMCGALAVRLALAPVSAGLQYLTFFPVVTISAIVGGYKPGLFATVIGLFFADYLFTPPYYSISITGIEGNLWSNTVFLLAGVIISFSIDALRQYGFLFKSTFEHAAVGLAHVSPDGGWLRVNEKICQIVGYSRDELLQKSFQDITHPDDLEADLEYVHQMLSGEINTYTMDKRYYHKLGSIIWIRLTVSLTRKPDGQPDYFISVVEDISQAKETETELKRLRSQFESLMDQQVAIQTLMALAHELNQPLNAAGSYSEAALRLMRPDEMDKERMREVIKCNISEIRRAGEVLRNLLHSVNRKQENAEILDLNQAIHESIRTYKDEVYRRPPSISVESDLSKCTVKAQKLFLQKALINLFRNAYQAMERVDQCKIIVRVIAAQESIVISVIDYGVGIKEEFVKDIFRPCFTTKANGVGMGLAISRGLIEDCGGKLWYASIDGRTAFHISLPSKPASDISVDK